MNIHDILYLLGDKEVIGDYYSLFQNEDTRPTICTNPDALIEIAYSLECTRIWIHASIEDNKTTSIQNLINKLDNNHTDIKYIIISREPYKINRLFKSSRNFIIADAGKFYEEVVKFREKKYLNFLKKKTVPKLTEIEVDLAIITALYDYEFDQVKEYVEVNEELSKNIFPNTPSRRIGKLKNTDLKVIIDYQDKMGQVDCSFLASIICTKYRPKLLVMTGVCGGRITKNVKLGDIIIPMEIHDYQTGKYNQKGFVTLGYQAKINSEYFKAKIHDWEEDILHEMQKSTGRDKDKMKSLTVHIKESASGSLVLKKGGELDRIAKDISDNIISVDMESYAVARICNKSEFQNTKAIIIKSVMDYADENKKDSKGDFNYKEWAAYTSASFAYHFIQKLNKDGYFEENLSLT